MRQTTIAQSASFTLLSYGNGWAYLLANRALKRSVFLQDDDATLFRSELDAHAEANPQASQEEILGWLWEEYAAASTAED